MATARDPLEVRSPRGPSDADHGDDDREPHDAGLASDHEALPFKRRLVVPGLVLVLGEFLLVALPVWTLFGLRAVPTGMLWRIGAPIAVGAALVWAAAFAAWILPVRRAVVLRRRGDRVSRDLAARAYRAILRLPVRVVLLRTALWAGSAAIAGNFLARYGGWPLPRVVELIAVTAMHAVLLAAARGVWLSSIMTGLRGRLFAVTPPLRRFADSYFRRLVLVAIVVAAGTLTAQAAFLYYFLPVSHEQYLQIQTYVPAALAVGLVAWVVIARLSTHQFQATLEAAQKDGDPGAADSATLVYKRAQSLPYRLSLIGLGMWIVIAVGAGLVARFHLRFDFDDAAIIGTVLVVLSLGGAIYESLWHRETMRPLLQHLSVRYRVPVRMAAPALPLQKKLLLSLGGVVMLACSLALLWGFVQYKGLVTEASARQAELGLVWLRSEVQAAAASHARPPDPALVHTVLRSVGAQSPEASAVIYYVDDRGPLRRGSEVVASTGSDQVVAIGGGPMGAPRLPWYVAAQMRRTDGAVSLAAAELSGRARRLAVSWRGRSYDLGAVAVLYPSYRGRGPSMVRPLKELLVFFVVLFGACAGIVVVTVRQFVAPIRRLEQRSDAMARGELADPVVSGGEGDEVGRLTFALEEMRRALREKLRSTEEVNLDLERAVQMRTADLARKNKELAETLDKLTRAQAQLVRSEKLASIGQLVAGIAHEINNPVNAIVNTVGPLEEAVAELDRAADDAGRGEAADDIRDMVRVVQRGAQRTKAIVQALHNYSRTDDEHLVDFDLDRSLDDSLELLRHLLRGVVAVERNYGEVGRVRGHAGQIGQVFMNLLTNAAQALAGKPDARITIETRVAGDSVVVRICDNGPGIPPDVLPRIWDPFFTTKDVGDGTGLGLSIVHELVERHGGTIEVDTQLGAGTTFTVTLPRRAEAARPGRSTARPPAKS
jgi:signal transduction histidine kinase